MLPPLDTSRRRRDFAAAASTPPGLGTDDVQEQIDAAVGEPVFYRLTQSIAPSAGRLAYLYRHHATSGSHSNEYTMAVPAGGSYFAAFSFAVPFGSTIHYLWRFGEALAAVNTKSDDVSVAVSGTWPSTANTGVYGGQYRSNATAGSTITKTVTGHTLFARLYATTNAGFALVAIDGDYTAANRLPLVSATEVAAGWFSAGDIGKRYMVCYAASTEEDRQVCLAEGLTDAPHVVTLKVQGTTVSGGLGNNVHVVAFAGATAGTLPSTANATLLHTRWVLNMEAGFSSVISVPSYTPTGFSNIQFIGEGHGGPTFEVFLSEQWRVDGADPALAAGGLASGTSVTFDRATRFDHPNAADCARRRVIHQCRTDSPMHLSNQITVKWNTAGTIDLSYAAMMPISELKAQSSLQFENRNFNKVRIGDRVADIPTLNDGAFNFKQPSGLVAVHSTAHDVVGVLYVPNETDAFDDWLNSDGFFASMQDRTDGVDKFYMVRSTSAHQEAVAVGTVHKWRTGYRVLRIEDAAVVLAA